MQCLLEHNYCNEKAESPMPPLIGDSLFYALGIEAHRVKMRPACIEQVEKPEPKEIDKTGAFYINKNNTTYEIYTNKGELILEYTPRNTDSVSLKTLEDLYQNVKYFYNREEIQEPKRKINTRAI